MPKLLKILSIILLIFLSFQASALYISPEYKPSIEDIIFIILPIWVIFMVLYFVIEKAFETNEANETNLNLKNVWSKKRYFIKFVAEHSMTLLFAPFLLLFLVGMIDIYWKGKVADRPLPTSKSYHYPKGNTTKITKDQALAAEKGSSAAQYEFGLRFFKGDKNTPQDLKKALYWFRKAAENGLLYAQYDLGKMYDVDGSEERDDEEAFKWYLKSAEQGYNKAQALIGFMYQFGAGVQKDNTKAYMWYRLSGSTAQHLIINQMSPSEIKAGDNLVKNWKVKR